MTADAMLCDVRLGDVLDIRDGTHDTPDYVAHGIPLVTSKNLTDTGLSFKDAYFISKDAHREISKRSAVNKGDILFGMIGTIGNPTLVETEQQFSIKNVALFRRSNDRIDNRFVRWLLSSPPINQQLTQASKGGTQKFVSLGALRGLIATFPQLPEQRRIAAILDQADALRAKRREALAHLDTLTQSIFIEMFGDPATNPKGWPIRKIGELLESASYGTSEKSAAEGRFPVLRMNNITRTGEIDLTDLKYMNLDDDEYDRYLVRTGDVLFNRTNSAELVGKTAIYRHTEPVAYAGYLIRLRANAENDPEYLGRFLNSAYAKRMLRGMCKSIIGMANINATEIQAMKIAQPPTSVQREFGQRVRAVEHVKARHRESLAELNTLFASLQHRAFRGEL